MNPLGGGGLLRHLLREMGRLGSRVGDNNAHRERHMLPHFVLHCLSANSTWLLLHSGHQGSHELQAGDFPLYAADLFCLQ